MPQATTATARTRTPRLIAMTSALLLALVQLFPTAAAGQNNSRTNTRISAGGAARDTLPTASLPARCTTVLARSPATAAPASDNDRAAARELAIRAQAASIQGDNAGAIALYQRATLLNPADAGVAYALGREYEVAHDAHAMTAYCHFLTLAPGGADAADVRQRVAALALALPPDTTVVRVAAAASAVQLPSPGAALAQGLIIPGLGQFTTRRPAGGLLVMAATAAAAWYAAQSETVSSTVIRSATDPFGNAYQYPTTVSRTQHPHLVVGATAAAAVMVTSAIEAFTHARAQRSRAQLATASTTSRPSPVSTMVEFTGRALGIGLAIR